MTLLQRMRKARRYVAKRMRMEGLNPHDRLHQVEWMRRAWSRKMARLDREPSKM